MKYSQKEILYDAMQDLCDNLLGFIIFELGGCGGLFGIMRKNNQYIENQKDVGVE